MLPYIFNRDSISKLVTKAEYLNMWLWLNFTNNVIIFHKEARGLRHSGNVGCGQWKEAATAMYSMPLSGELGDRPECQHCSLFAIRCWAKHCIEWTSLSFSFHASKTWVPRLRKILQIFSRSKDHWPSCFYALYKGQVFTKESIFLKASGERKSYIQEVHSVSGGSQVWQLFIARCRSTGQHICFN